MDNGTGCRYTAEQQAAIIHRHLVDKVPVAVLCEEYAIAPSMLHAWQKQLRDQMAQPLGQDQRSDHMARPARLSNAERRVQLLAAKLAKQNSVIAEISAEYLRLKQRREET